MTLKNLFLGRTLANTETESEKMGVAAGVAAIGLDGLSSAAYGPEAGLALLVPLGAAAPGYLAPIMLVILAILGILYLSYRQVIEAYPVNGGSYTVAKENLGMHAGLLAAAALMIDYVLNVAVGISAGIGALVSAMPSWQPATLWLCLAMLGILTLVNLRGTKESGLAFELPTYFFIGSLLAAIAVGLVKMALAGGHPAPVAAPAALPPATATLGLWIVLRAFASGCTAMTGVEAVSNGVTAFIEPSVSRAKRTLTIIVVLLALLLAGIAVLCNGYGIGAMDETQGGYQSVLSQLLLAVWGQGILYYVAIASILAVLCLSANTSFVGFPRLCRLVARDEFLPRSFALPGRRLVYSVGILYLAVTAGILLAVFGGITENLIPLFAVGAFLAFTMAQAGMAMHWRKAGGAPLRLAINLVGAAATGVALLVILVAKFADGAWITVLVIPCVFWLLTSVKRQYRWEARVLRDRATIKMQTRDAVMVVMTKGWNKLTDQALTLALNLGKDVIAVHLTELEGPDAVEPLAELRREWRHQVEVPVRQAGREPPRLEIVQSPYRRLIQPCLGFVAQVRHEFPDRPIALLIPELVKMHWWQHILHGHRGIRLRNAILRHGGGNIAVIEVPYYLEETHIEDALAEEDRAAAFGPQTTSANIK
jgi:amino acid transporter